MARSHGTRNHITRTVVATGTMTEPSEAYPDLKPVEKFEYTSWCGEKRMGYERSSPYGFESYAGVQSCTKCKSKHAAAELKANPIQFKLGERVNASDENNPYHVTTWSSFKSVYPVIDTTILADEERDRVVGFVAIDNGWGKQWQVHGWEGTTRSSMDAPGEPKFSTGGVLSYDKAYSSDPEAKLYPHECKRLPSKEDALMLFPLLSEQGKLKTRPMILANDQAFLDRARESERRSEIESQERAARRERERVAAASEREQLIADIVVALDQEFLGNFVTDVLFRTAKAAGITEAEITAAMPKPEPVAPRSNVDLLRVTAEEIADHGNAPLYDPGPLAEVETDEWGEIIASR